MRIPPGSLALLAILVCLPLAAPATAKAEEACEPAEPRVPRGLNVRASLGPAIWVGDVSEYSQPGLGFTFGVGYEFFSWLALEASWSTGFHNTDQPRPPSPGSFATHAFHGGLRLTVPVGPFDIFARGGAGLMWSQPDILVRLEDFDSESRLAWMGGLGFSWHTPRRHIWIGIEASALGAIGFPGILITSSAVIGVTLW